MVDHFTVEVGETWLKVDKKVARILQEKLNEVLTIATMLDCKTDFVYGDQNNPRRTYVSLVSDTTLYSLTFDYDIDLYLQDIKVYKNRQIIAYEKPRGKSNAFLKAIEVMKEQLRTINDTVQEVV